ncbi:glutathione transferase GstA [Sphingorhabdus pulchriflava]|uniref:Glutathione transferase GstA n=1 Tax=Sphingorhabdus pulchriflava TaxID=2292257 RepID=A0A371BI95_9SPHN|nr:glutathione transferase GstA [Sphingorhabdus pulchriflava]RDV07258.1 glutathione transferase GstA [Sphingorhabdus pulchriflava]
MKLYYSPGACSLSPHIILRELDSDFELARVDLATKTVDDGRDFNEVTAKGQVPALELDDGTVLTEGVAIVQYLADQKPDAGLMPPVGSVERARVQETLNFISSELHKSFGPLFNPATSHEGRAAASEAVAAKLSVLEAQLSDGRPWLAGDAFSPADSYGFAVTRWAPFQGIVLDHWPSLSTWLSRVESRSGVQAALASEA